MGIIINSENFESLQYSAVFHAFYLLLFTYFLIFFNYYATDYTKYGFTIIIITFT